MVKMPNWPLPMFQNKIELGLQRIEKLLEVLGNPHLDIPPVIHITGTNGKGSTLSFMKSILEHAGYKTHSYTSPHLVEFNERIRIAGTKISDKEIFELSEICRIAEQKLKHKVTFFEGVTAMAFLAFKNTKADFTLLEVGMGGRLDATNVVNNTIASVITPISYDHIDQLGNSLSQIAFEKCGILRSDAIGIISMQTDEASKVINEYAKRIGTKLYEYEYDFGCKLEDGYFTFSNKDEGQISYPLPSLIGDHQIINASTAIETIKQLKLSISNEIISQALQNTYWPGRLEKITEGKILEMLPNNRLIMKLGSEEEFTEYLARRTAVYSNVHEDSSTKSTYKLPSELEFPKKSDWEVWVDGAHNDSGAQILANWATHNRELPLYIICGMTRGRNSENFLSYFKDVADFIVGVKVSNESMSYSGEYVADAAKKLGINSISLESAFEAIEFLTTNFTKGKILICGSLYLAGEILFMNNK